jgi:hypothetical protein
MPHPTRKARDLAQRRHPAARNITPAQLARRNAPGTAEGGHSVPSSRRVATRRAHAASKSASEAEKP